jgi:hypothetical protein
MFGRVEHARFSLWRYPSFLNRLSCDPADQVEDVGGNYISPRRMWARASFQRTTYKLIIVLSVTRFLVAAGTSLPSPRFSKSSQFCNFQ